MMQYSGYFVLLRSDDIVYSFIDLIIETLTIVKEPLSPKEIWEKAIELNIAHKVNSSGKTPWATLGERI